MGSAPSAKAVDEGAHMVAYNFRSRFADAVQSGLKLQTIRAPRVRGHARPGDALQLYTGMRTRACRKLADALCLASTHCILTEGGVWLGDGSRAGLDDFAQADGFGNFEEMRTWFRKTHGLPFEGQLIRWRLFRAETDLNVPFAGRKECGPAEGDLES